MNCDITVLSFTEGRGGSRELVIEKAPEN